MTLWVGDHSHAIEHSASDVLRNHFSLCHASNNLIPSPRNHTAETHRLAKQSLITLVYRTRTHESQAAKLVGLALLPGSSTPSFVNLQKVNGFEVFYWYGSLVLMLFGYGKRSQNTISIAVGLRRGVLDTNTIRFSAME